MPPAGRMADAGRGVSANTARLRKATRKGRSPKRHIAARRCETLAPLIGPPTIGCGAYWRRRAMQLCDRKSPEVLQGPEVAMAS